MSVRLTEKRLEVIISALAYWETILGDMGINGCSEADYRQQEKEREQAFMWAHQELAKRKAKKTA